MISLIVNFRKCTFSLLTFCSSYDLDLSSWGLEHPSLTCVATAELDIIDFSEDDLTLFRRLSSSSSHHCPVTVSCHYRSGAIINSMVVFPAFAPVANGVTSWSAEPIKRHFSLYHRIGLRSIRVFDAFVTSFADKSGISKVVESIARNFATVSRLGFIVQDKNIHLVSIDLAVEQPDLRYSIVSRHAFSSAFTLWRAHKYFSSL
jgi:hypothetical protein